jgi:Putative adhesin
MQRFDALLGHTRLTPWGRLVAISVCVLLAVTIAMAVWWAATAEQRTGFYAVRGTLSSILLDIGAADAVIVGSHTRPTVEVRRTDSFAFGRPAESRRDVSGGVLRLDSRCPQTVLPTCSARYRLTVPDNVPVTVRTDSGDVRFRSFRGSARIDTQTGDISADGFCGFSLVARADTGAVRATASCAPERLQLRSRTGSVDAVVPPGRYRVDADSDEGDRRVSGVTATDDAPFQIQALSGTGDVTVVGGP